jgi:hypothetical protein
MLWIGVVLSTFLEKNKNHMKQVLIYFFAGVGFMSVLRELSEQFDLPFFQSKVDYLSAFLITGLLYFQNKETNDAKDLA